MIMNLYVIKEEIEELEEGITQKLPAGITFTEIIDAANGDKLDEYNLSEELVNMAEDYLRLYIKIERELVELQKLYNELKW